MCCYAFVFTSCERGLDISSDVLKKFSAGCFTCLRCVDVLCIEVYSYSQQMHKIPQIFLLSTTLDSLPISVTVGYLARAHTYTSTCALMIGFYWLFKVCFLDLIVKKLNLYPQRE